MGFSWDPHEEAWQSFYTKLQEYKNEYGDTQVPAKCVYQDVNLGGWVVTQRSKYKLGKLDREKETLLRHIGFTWTLRRGKT